jgi:hypothetical protein
LAAEHGEEAARLQAEIGQLRAALEQPPARNGDGQDAADPHQELDAARDALAAERRRAAEQADELGKQLKEAQETADWLRRELETLRQTLYNLGIEV